MLLVTLSGIQANCSTSKECALKAEIEPTNVRHCKTDKDCPNDSHHRCGKDFYYACLNNGECTCISV